MDDLIARSLGLITDDLIRVAAICALGVVWSVAFTGFIKPFLGRGTPRTRLIIRAWAFFAASIPTGLMLYAFVPCPTQEVRAVLIAVVAPLAGLVSPLGVWAWRDIAMPWLASKARGGGA